MPIVSNQMYIFGGQMQNNTINTNVYVYESDSNTWQKLCSQTLLQHGSGVKGVTVM